MRLVGKIIGAAFLFAVTNVFADGFSMSVGSEYSTGKYGTGDTTRVTYVPTSVSYDKGAFSFKLVVPWITVTGPGDVVPSGISGSSSSSSVVSNVVCTTSTSSSQQTVAASSADDNGGNRQKGKSSGSSGKSSGGSDDSASSSSVVTVQSTSETCETINTTVTTTKDGEVITTKRKRTTQSGIGDVVAAATYNLVDNEVTGLIVDVTGRIKFATASVSKNLGSGENDYTLQVNVDKYFGSPYLSFGLGYKWLGEPSGVNFNNVTYGSVGGGYKISNDSSVGVSYDWATAVVDGAERPREVSIYGSHRLSENYKLSAVVFKGLSDVNPDIGGGLTLNYFF